jgi:hypothetical protein
LTLHSFKPVALSLILAGAALAQKTPAKTILVVNGHTAEGAVVQINGHPYVDVNALARMMNAVVNLEPGRVIVTIPALEPGSRPDQPAAGLSKDFAKAGISQLAAMWEWKGAIASAIRSGVAGGSWLAPWLQDHRVRAEGSLSQASLAAKTESDQKALQLLKNQLATLGEWDSTTQATIHSLNGEQTVNPTVAQNDPLLTKISACGNFLNAMLVSGEFVDNPSCH